MPEAAAGTGAGTAVFSEHRAREVLAAAGHPGAAADAPLIAFGENAVLALGDEGPVVKIGRSPELLGRARRELGIAHWLAEQNLPSVRPAEPEARLVDGHPVTYWYRLPAAVRPARAADLAELLRMVHALPDPPSPCPAGNCWAASSAGCGSPVTRSTRPTPPICGSAATGSRRPRPGWCPGWRPARSTGTRSPAMCTSARTAPCSSIWRPSRTICASTTWW